MLARGWETPILPPFLHWTEGEASGKLRAESVCRKQFDRPAEDSFRHANWTNEVTRVLTMNANRFWYKLMLAVGIGVGLLSGMGAHEVCGQQPFSGSGIPGGSVETERKGLWPFGGTGASTSSGGGMRMPWGDGAKNNVVEPAGGNAGWLGFPRPSWLQPKDPNAPTLMEQASERSRAFWSRTQDGWSHFSTKTGESFRNMNQNIRTATSESWARMTGGSAAGEQRPGEVRPPVGDNENWLNKNKDR